MLRRRNWTTILGILVSVMLNLLVSCDLLGGGDNGVTSVAAPAFSPAAGSYSGSVTVTLTSSTSGASIRYTANGSDPTPTSGTIYSSPFTLSTSTTIKAIAYTSSTSKSGVTSAVYTIANATISPPVGATQLNSGSYQDFTLSSAEQWYYYEPGLGSSGLYSANWQGLNYQAVGGAYTAAIKVSLYTGLSSLSEVVADSSDGYTYPKVVNLLSGERLYFLVEPSVSTASGTFALKIDAAPSEGQASAPVQLVLDDAHPGKVGGVYPTYDSFYKFTSAEAGNYQVLLDSFVSSATTSDYPYLYLYNSSSFSSYIQSKTDSTFPNYLFTNLNSNTEYYLKVSNYNSPANPTAVYTITVRKEPPLDAPSKLTTYHAGSGKVQLEWASVADATSYLVESSSTAGGPWTSGGTTSSSIKTATIGSLTPGSLYYFKVTPYKSAAAGNSITASYTVLDEPELVLGGAYRTDYMPTAGVVKYKIPVTNGTSYALTWEDYYQKATGNPNATAWVKVTVYKSDLSTKYPSLNQVSGGYTTSRTFTATETGFAFIEIIPYSSSSSYSGLFQFKAGLNLGGVGVIIQ